LRTNEEIASKIARCPKDERDARIEGKASRKSGKIYSDFDRNKHVQFFDLCNPKVKLWNTFMAYDPHPKYYPFIQWWGYTPEGFFVCYNEWPTFEMFGKFYDEVRKDLICPYNVQTISEFIKIYDGTQFGLAEPERYLDPYYGFAAGNSVGLTESLQSKFVEYGIKFFLPQRNLIEVQREEIRELIKFDPQNPLSEPQMLWMPHCVNSIRMMERHGWGEDEKEDEKFKEGPDDTRNMLAGFAKRGYKSPTNGKAIISPANSESLSEYMKNMPSISLG
jgi:hypothetical protein